MNIGVISRLSIGQPKKDRPTLLKQLTLLDVIANGTSIRLFKETLATFENGARSRYVMSVRRQGKTGWVSKQMIWPEGKLELALLEANKAAQQEIQRVSLQATA